VEYLTSTGLKVNYVILEELDIIQQVSVIHNSSILIGNHGAGLVHLLWINPGSIVIELFPLNYKKFIYLSLSKLSGLHYISWINTQNEHTQVLQKCKPIVLHSEESTLFKPLNESFADVSNGASSKMPKDNVPSEKLYCFRDQDTFVPLQQFYALVLSAMEIIYNNK